MKKKILLLLFVSCILAACGSDDDDDQNKGGTTEIVKDLKLSVDAVVTTDSMDYEFEITDGNGEYTASVSEDDAKVTISGTKVTVNMLNHDAVITITDKKQKTASVSILSFHQSLNSCRYIISTTVDREPSVMDHISFGVGGYRVEKISGTSAQVEMTTDGNVKVTGLTPGNSYYKIIDKRGKVAPLDVLVGSIVEAENNKINIKAVNDQMISVVLKWGEGDWSLAEATVSPLFKKVVLMSADIDNKYDVLQIDTSKDDVKGDGYVLLRDKANNLLTVKVTIE